MRFISIDVAWLWVFFRKMRWGENPCSPGLFCRPVSLNPLKFHRKWNFADLSLGTEGFVRDSLAKKPASKEKWRWPKRKRLCSFHGNLELYRVYYSPIKRKIFSPGFSRLKEDEMFSTFASILYIHELWEVNTGRCISRSATYLLGRELRSFFIYYCSRWVQ